MTRWEWIIDFIVQPGVIQIADVVAHDDSSYLMEKEGRQQLARSTKAFFETRDLPAPFTGRRQMIGENRFHRKHYTVWGRANGHGVALRRALLYRLPILSFVVIIVAGDRTRSHREPHPPSHRRPE